MRAIRSEGGERGRSTVRPHDSAHWHWRGSTRSVAAVRRRPPRAGRLMASQASSRGPDQSWSSDLQPGRGVPCRRRRSMHRRRLRRRRLHLLHRQLHSRPCVLRQRKLLSNRGDRTLPHGHRLRTRQRRSLRRVSLRRRHVPAIPRLLRPRLRVLRERRLLPRRWKVRGRCRLRLDLVNLWRPITLHWRGLRSYQRADLSRQMLFAPLTQTQT